MAIDVLCIGHASYDLSVFVDAFPEENCKSETQVLLECGGGPAANAAYLLSKWGTRCAFAGLVGDDQYGKRVREEFAAVGTDVTLLETRSGHVTPVSLIVINKQNGSRTIVNRKIQESALEPQAQTIADMFPRVLLFDGHELQASLAALDACPGAISILDAGSWREGTAKLAERVDYLVASERFAMRAAGLSKLNGEGNQRACIRRLQEQYAPATIVVTLGENGLITGGETGFYHLPAFPARAVDTTGAGDIFHGAFAHCVLQEMGLTDALRFSSRAASLSVQVAGGRCSIPSLAEVTKAWGHAD